VTDVTNRRFRRNARWADSKGVERAAKESMATHVRAMLEFLRQARPEIQKRERGF
jgi:urocanate hydratase